MTTATLTARLGATPNAAEDRTQDRPVLSPADARTVAAFEQVFQKTFTDIQRAMEHPDDWPELGKRDDFKQLSLRLRFHVLGARHQDAAPIHGAMLAAACNATGLLARMSTRGSLQPEPGEDKAGCRVAADSGIGLYASPPFQAGDDPMGSAEGGEDEGSPMAV